MEEPDAIMAEAVVSDDCLHPTHHLSFGLVMTIIGTLGGTYMLWRITQTAFTCTSAFETLEMRAVTLRRGKTRHTFAWTLATNLISALNAVLIGPFALLALTRIIMHKEASESGVMLVRATRDEALCHAFRALQVSGTIFLGYILALCASFLIGWDRGVDKAVHHLLYATIGTASWLWGHLPELAAAALAMEISTVPLAAVQIFREPVGYERVATLTGRVFGIAFMLLRVVLFGVVLLRSLMLWWTHPEAFIEAGPVRVALTQVGYTAGWLLQCFWAWTILLKYAITGKLPDEQEDGEAVKGKLTKQEAEDSSGNIYSSNIVSINEKKEKKKKKKKKKRESGGELRRKEGLVNVARETNRERRQGQRHLIEGEEKDTLATQQNQRLKMVPQSRHHRIVRMAG